ncbi:hypothetical protein [Planomonospora venezuelensis]|uniref:hypothetical protein n=1 Tax=Planomonospora venezuelensis TaxID=1999 RepID=UPI0031EF2610
MTIQPEAGPYGPSRSAPAEPFTHPAFFYRGAADYLAGTTRFAGTAWRRESPSRWPCPGATWS